MRARRALLIVAALALAACSNRERTNPFDPRNPRTGGRPADFAAVAGDATVLLQWRRVAIDGLLGYRIERRADDEPSYRVIADLLESAASLFVDAGLRNGIDHHYRIRFVFADGPRGQPAEDVAAPGPARPWVTDLEAPAVVRIAPDGRRIAFADRDVDGPAPIAVDPGTGTVWVGDTFGQRVVIRVPGIPVPRVVSGIPDPLAIAVDPVDHTAWVSDGANARVVHLDAAGTVATPPSLQGVLDPVALAVDLRDRSIWVCEGRGNKVRRFDPAGLPMWGVDVPQPSRVALDSLTGAGWVTSLQRRTVTLLRQDGVAVDTVGGFGGPIGIAVDARRGRIWVADAAADQLLALRRTGDVEFRVGGLDEVREVAIDPATGEAWATLAGAGAVVRVSPAGQVLRRLGGLERPYGIAVDPGRR